MRRSSRLSIDSLRAYKELLAREIESRRRTDPTTWPLSTPQREFHEALEPERCLAGGNTSGKTFVGIREARLFAEGRHPLRKVEAPNFGWIVSLTFKNSEDITEPYLGVRPDPGIIPIFPPGLGTWKAQRRVLELPGGSAIGLMSCDAGADKFQGPKRRWIMFDEEPPQDIYRECLARTIPGETLDVWICMTPTKGLSWTHDQYVMNPVPGRHRIVYAPVESNLKLTPRDLEEIRARVQRDPLKEARLLGRYVAVGERPAFPFEPLSIWLERAGLLAPDIGHLDSDGEFQDTGQGPLSIWSHPQPGMEYVIGADVAEGIPDGAWSVASIWRLPDREQVAEYRERIAPIRFGRRLATLGHLYNEAFIVPEVNNHGHATVGYLIQEEDYRNVYQRVAQDSDREPGFDAQWGFWTSGQTKYDLEQLLYDLVASGRWNPRSQTLIKEMMGASRDRLGELIPGRGLWLDCVIAAGLAMVGARKKRFIGWPERPAELDTIEHLREKIAELEEQSELAVAADDWRY